MLALERRGPPNPMDADQTEEELSGPDDNVVPTRGYGTLPVVGLGGSASSLVSLLPRVS